MKSEVLIIYLQCCKLTCIACTVRLLPNYCFIDLFSMNQTRRNTGTRSLSAMIKNGLNNLSVRVKWDM